MLTRYGRGTLLAAILASALATIDGSIVNVALPAIERDLGGGLSAQQWVVNAYLLALGSLILIGGSLGDIYGMRRVFRSRPAERLESTCQARFQRQRPRRPIGAPGAIEISTLRRPTRCSSGSRKSWLPNQVRVLGLAL